MTRTREEVINDLKILVSSKGYIYVICMIMVDDFHVNPEILHKINLFEKLSFQEAAFLIGLLIQDKIDLTKPDDFENLLFLKKKTYELLKELHDTFMQPFIKKMKEDFIGKNKNKDITNADKYRKDLKNFWSHGEMMIEPIFYSGSGVYDFQYLDYLDKKYKYDKKWLYENKKYEVEEISNIVMYLKNLLQERSNLIYFTDINKDLQKVKKKLSKEQPNEDCNKYIEEVKPLYELRQYSDLFGTTKNPTENWNSFYNNLLNIFIVSENDLSSFSNGKEFLTNFSILPSKGINSELTNIGKYNVFCSHPILKLDKERYFIPLTYMLFQAVYESPFYWMINDNKYKNIVAENRGKVGEEIVFDQLINVFGENNIFRGVKIVTKKGFEVTDIDVLCVLGNKALSIQIKSKGLTLLSRQGDELQLQKDFQNAIQDAYKQGLIAREKIIKRDAKFFTLDGKEIILSDQIDEIYLMCVTTENYPALSYISHIMLDKNENDPFPLCLTIFDLELIIHYLLKPVDLLYYIRQRINLMDYFIAHEEMTFLGYHLDQKLWKIPNADIVSIDGNFAQLIDRNYYPLKAGIKVSDKGDSIKNRWKNDNFDRLCSDIIKVTKSDIVDIIFYLYDLSGKTRTDLCDYIIKSKNKTLKDNKNHDLSIPFINSKDNIGITYLSLYSNNPEELRISLNSYCELKKYSSKSNIWIGLGSLKDSKNMVDAVVYLKYPWIYDVNLDKYAKNLIGKGQVKRFRKIGRNEKCICGSGLKFKNCCGKNI